MKSSLLRPTTAGSISSRRSSPYRCRRWLLPSPPILLPSNCSFGEASSGASLVSFPAVLALVAAEVVFDEEADEDREGEEEDDDAEDVVGCGADADHDDLEHGGDDELRDAADVGRAAGRALTRGRGFLRRE